MVPNSTAATLLHQPGHICALASRGRFWRFVKIGFSKWKGSALSGTWLSNPCLRAQRLRSTRSGKDPHLPYRGLPRRSVRISVVLIGPCLSSKINDAPSAHRFVGPARNMNVDKFERQKRPGFTTGARMTSAWAMLSETGFEREQNDAALITVWFTRRLGEVQFRTSKRRRRR
jgi:hypothetical protein